MNFNNRAAARRPSNMPHRSCANTGGRPEEQKVGGTKRATLAINESKTANVSVEEVKLHAKQMEYVKK